MTKETKLDISAVYSLDNIHFIFENDVWNERTLKNNSWSAPTVVDESIVKDRIGRANRTPSHIKLAKLLLCVAFIFTGFQLGMLLIYPTTTLTLSNVVSVSTENHEFYLLMLSHYELFLMQVGLAITSIAVLFAVFVIIDLGRSIDWSTT